MLLKTCQRIALVLLCLAMASPSLANWMGGFELDHGPVSYLGRGEEARVTFDFSVSNPGGVIFVIYGYLDGARVLGASWGSIPVYPAGTEASHTTFISYSTGDVVLDQVRVLMLDPGNLAVLLEMSLPVDYHFGSNAVNDIQFSHSSPSWILNGDNLTLDFAYQTEEAGGVRISARPYYQGHLAVGYAASSVAFKPVGNGTASQYFRFNSGDRDIDAVGFKMYNSDQSVLLLEFLVPVDLHWRAHSFSNITFDPPSPDCLAWGQEVTVDFDYATSDPAGCFAWARGADADTTMISGQVYTGSLTLPVSGHQVRKFSMSSGTGEFKFVHLSMKDINLATVLLEVDVPISLAYGPNAVNRVTMRPSLPAVLDYGEFVDVAFEYSTVDPNGVRVYNDPRHFGAIVPGYIVNPSILYTGSGSGSAYFTLTSGGPLVNFDRLYMTEADAETFLMDNFVPVNHTFGGVGGLSEVADVTPAMGPIMRQNFPNPFNPQTTITFDLPQPAVMDLRVFGVSGRLVKVLLGAEPMAAGRRDIVWNGRNDVGQRVASGVYFYRLSGGGHLETRRMSLVK